MRMTTLAILEQHISKVTMENFHGSMLVWGWGLELALAFVLELDLEWACLSEPTKAPPTTLKGGDRSPGIPCCPSRYFHGDSTLQTIQRQPTWWYFWHVPVSDEEGHVLCNLVRGMHDFKPSWSLGAKHLYDMKCMTMEAGNLSASPALDLLGKALLCV